MTDFEIIQQTVKDRLATKPMRVSIEIHRCCLCQNRIKPNDVYFDGGRDNKAHARCVDPKVYGDL